MTTGNENVRTIVVTRMFVVRYATLAEPVYVRADDGAAAIVAALRFLGWSDAIRDARTYDDERGRRETTALYRVGCYEYRAYATEVEVLTA